jgi:hypothetical protein
MGWKVGRFKIPMEDFMIPQEKSAAVSRGLREAFGVTEFEDVRMLTSRLSSALVLRIVGFPSLILWRLYPFL